MKLEELTTDVLDPLVGSDFTIKFADGQQVALTLVKVARIMERVEPAKLKRQPFAAYFEAPDTFFLQQSMYPFAHQALGEETLPIFIVPVTREEGKYRYEAIFT